MKKTPQRVIDFLSAEIPAKISRNKFCLTTGINQNSVDKYMAGTAEPTQVSLEKLAAYFKVPVSYLRGDIDVTEPINPDTETERGILNRIDNDIHLRQRVIEMLKKKYYFELSDS